MYVISYKNHIYIRFVLYDKAKSALILEKVFKTNDFSIDDRHTLRLFDTSLRVGTLTKCFVENELVVDDAHTCEDTLEDYFKKVTGGVCIA